MEKNRGRASLIQTDDPSPPNISFTPIAKAYEIFRKSISEKKLCLFESYIKKIEPERFRKLKIEQSSSEVETIL